ncbi:hypothetical protein ACFE04_027606 [Oxalis oulophora]
MHGPPHRDSSSQSLNSQLPLRPASLASFVAYRAAWEAGTRAIMGLANHMVAEIRRLEEVNRELVHEVTFLKGRLDDLDWAALHPQGDEVIRIGCILQEVLNAISAALTFANLANTCASPMIMGTSLYILLVSECGENPAPSSPAPPRLRDLVGRIHIIFLVEEEEKIRVRSERKGRNPHTLRLIRVLEDINFSSEATFVKNSTGQSQMAGNYVRTIQNDFTDAHDRALHTKPQKLNCSAFS